MQANKHDMKNVLDLNAQVGLRTEEKEHLPYTFFNAFWLKYKTSLDEARGGFKLVCEPYL